MTGSNTISLAEFLGVNLLADARATTYEYILQGLLPCWEPSLLACGIEEELTVADTCRRKGTCAIFQIFKTINHPIAIGCQPRTEGCITIPTILEE